MAMAIPKEVNVNAFLRLVIRAKGRPTRITTRLPKGNDSTSFAKLLIEEAGVVATPGVGFGKHGEGFIRMALTVPEGRLKEAVGRIKKVL